MDIGVLTVPFGEQSLDETFDYLNDIGIGAVEIGCGGYPGEDHLDRREYLNNEALQNELMELLEEYNLWISALATHNNPLHPDDEIANEANTELREAIELAGQLGVDTVTCFSGLPAGSPNDETPNWVTAPWPTELSDAHKYQWEEVAIPYWKEIAEHADDHSVNVAIEMHPNMLVYEPHGMVRLHEATNEHIGANFDPSHLYWQGISITDAIRYLNDYDAIHHVHAKDTKVYNANARVKGVLDTVPYDDEISRSWLFRSIGYGHGEDHWKNIISTLRMAGYDGSLSIEHEDSLTSATEGLEKAVNLLERAVFKTTPGEAYWTE